MEIVPKPIRISNWDNGDEIIYKCPKCNYRLPINRLEDINFCFHCGVKFVKDLPKKVNDVFAVAYHKSSYDTQQIMLAGLQIQLEEEIK